jgi:ribosomal protein S18 acetylase RimI-like enzyme
MEKSTTTEDARRRSPELPRLHRRSVPGRPISIELFARVRLCREADLRDLEWFGALRSHRRLIEDAYRRQREGTNWMLVADVRGFPVGQLWVDLAAKRDAGLLWAFRVMTPFKGLGLGTALLGTAERMLARARIEQVEVGVEPWNRGALRLYRRAGFRVVGEEVVSYETYAENGEHARHMLDVRVLRKRLPTAPAPDRATSKSAAGAVREPARPKRAARTTRGSRTRGRHG